MAVEPHVPAAPGEGICTAHSKRTGAACRQARVPGATVCHYHGGAAPQVQKKARERLLEMVDPALHHLLILVEDAETEAVQIRAIENVLDRTGFVRKEQIDLGGKLSVDVSSRELLADRIARIAERKRSG